MSTATSRSLVKKFCGIGLIVAAATIAYWPALRGGFILDDDFLITENPLIKAPDGLHRIWFTSEPADYWPVTNSVFWLEWRTWGTNPTGYHVTNLVLHIATSLLLWVVLRKLLIPGAWLAALLFAIHPVNVESVAWIAQLKNALSMLWFLISIFAYLQATVPKSPLGETYSSDSKNRFFVSRLGYWYVISFLTFVLAMLSKGSVAVLPVVFLFIEWWRRGRVVKWDLIRVAPFFVVAAVLTLVNLWFQTHGTGIVYRSADFAQRLAGAGAIVWFYLSKAILPVGLSFVYAPWDIQTDQVLWWLPLIAAVSLTGVLWWKRGSWWGRPLLFAWAFFCVALLPVMGFRDVGFMQYSLVADHYQYLAIISVVALVAAGFNWCWQPGHALRWGAIPVVMLVVGALGFLTWRQAEAYGDPIRLYTETIEKNPDCWIAYSDLGIKLTDAGRYPEAIEACRQAIALKPGYFYAYNNLGNAFISAGRPQEAIEPLKEALQLKPDFAKALVNLGSVLIKLGRPQEAIEPLQQAVKLNPNLVEGRINLAVALKRANRLPEAIQQYEQVLRLDVDPATTMAAHFNLAIALVDAGELSQAVEQFQQALKLRPDYAEGYYRLALVYDQLQQPGPAIAAAQKGVELARAQGKAALEQQITSWLAAHGAR